MQIGAKLQIADNVLRRDRGKSGGTARIFCGKSAAGDLEIFVHHQVGVEKDLAEFERLSRFGILVGRGDGGAITEMICASSRMLRMLYAPLRVP